MNNKYIKVNIFCIVCSLLILIQCNPNNIGIVNSTLINLGYSQRYAIGYYVDKNGGSPTNPNPLNGYYNLTDTLQADPVYINRLIFPRVSRGIANPQNLTSPLYSLRVYGDIYSINKINIPKQFITRIKGVAPYDTFGYQIMGDTNNCYIDTAYNGIPNNFRIYISYTIYILKKLSTIDNALCRTYFDTITNCWYGGVSPSSPGYYKFEQSTEIYRKM